MDLKTRLTRRPVTTVLWILLVSAMALFLSVGTALWYSSANLFATLDEYHSAVAYRLDRSIQYVPGTDGNGYFNSTDRTLKEEQVAELEAMDSVKDVHFHTLSGGYSPSFEPALGVRNGSIHCFEWYHLSCESYREVMVVGTVEKIHYVQELDMEDTYGGEAYQATGSFLVNIEEIVLAHESYKIETAFADNHQMNIYMTFVGEDAQAYIQPGERYVFYGYYDPQETYISYGTATLGKPIQRVGLDCYSAFLSDGSLQSKRGIDYLDGDPLMQVAVKLDGTVEEFLSDPQNSRWAEQVADWHLRQHSIPVMGTPALETFYVFMKHQANMVEGRMFTQEEYDAGTKVCILSDTLAARSGLKVGDTIQLSQFLVHEENESVNTLANDGFLNNPTVGSPLKMPDFVAEDETFIIVGIYHLMDEWVNTSYSITPNTVFIPQKAQIADTFGGPDQKREITVYVQTYDGVGPDANIVKEETVREERMVENGAFGIYLSIELVNGKVEEFIQEISKDSKLKGQFHTLDSGLEKAYKSIEALSISADKLILIVGLGWLLLLALYVLLYQGSQRKNLGTMRSLGASPKVARSYLFGSGMALASLGVLLGGIISVVVFQVVQSKITENTLSLVDQAAYGVGSPLTQESVAEMVQMSQLSVPMMLVLWVVQLAVIALVLWIHANRLSKQSPRKLMGV